MRMGAFSIFIEFSKKAKQVGFDGFANMDLQIGLNSNGFYDVYQDVNWSDIECNKIQGWYENTAFSALADIDNTKCYQR